MDKSKNSPKGGKEPEAEDKGEYRKVCPDGPVGFCSITDQIVFKTMAKEISFNLMCVGETGIGKSSLLDSLFNTSLNTTQSPHTLPAVGLKVNMFQVQEAQINLRLTLIESVGFNDQINKENSIQVLIEYIDAQYEAYFQEEMKLNRSMADYFDQRVHACIYVIRPTGHGLRQIDIMFMKQLDRRIHIIPVIGKSDSLDKVELRDFKRRIREQMKENEIHVYKCPLYDDLLSEKNQILNKLMPLAVVGSNEYIKYSNTWMRVRNYPWGMIFIEDPDHCEFSKLRELLIHLNMQNLISSTHQKFYEKYRIERLQDLNFFRSLNTDDYLKFQVELENQRDVFQREFQEKDEALKDKFMEIAKKKEDELKFIENQILEKFSILKKKYMESKKHLDDEDAMLDEDISHLEKIKIESKLKMEEMGSNGLE